MKALHQYTKSYTNFAKDMLWINLCIKKELMDYFISTSSFTLYRVYYRLNCSSLLIQYSII